MSTGLRISILMAQRINEPCVLESIDWLGSGSLEGSPSDEPGDSVRFSSCTPSTLSAHLTTPSSCVATRTL